jgi:hypothetical protein
MRTICWWALHILVLFVCSGFLLLGIKMLRGAYGMQDPLNFFIAFFGSSMLIVITGALIVGFAIKIILRWRGTLDNQLNQK